MASSALRHHDVANFLYCRVTNSVLAVTSMKTGLLGATAMVLCLSCASALAQQPISTPILISAPNFRDLAGISASNGGTGFAYTTSNNGVMRTGVFYRTDVLSLSVPDLATISALHITLDIDLRTPDEINGSPDAVPKIAAAPDAVPIGAAYTNVNIYGGQSPPAPATQPTTAHEEALFFQSLYRGFVANQIDRDGFRAALIDLANAADAADFHCSGGKDRTGWTAALLQTIAGVSPATILKDYLATNIYTAAFIQSQKETIYAQYAAGPGGAKAGADAVAIATPALGVQQSFLQAALDQVTATYGSMQAYLTQGLGLTQADIYVLRAKMVDYLTLPGQDGFTGNAAAGAALLNALQASPLSGHYTAYNYYLQSAVDAGTLGGVESEVGGQVHADAFGALLRQPRAIDAAIAHDASGRDLVPGQSRVWMVGLGGYVDASARGGIAGSIEQTAGSVVGATYRIDERVSASFGLGYDWSSVASAGASADVGTLLGTIGGRFGFSSLEAGPFVAAQAMIGGVDYRSKRPLGGGLGVAQGNGGGAVYSGQAAFGDVIPLSPVTITLHGGLRVTHASLGGFTESGSELALAVHGMNRTMPSFVAGLEVTLDARQVGGWSITPRFTLGYELALANPQVVSNGTLYGYTVTQASAYDSRSLVTPGFTVSARRDAFELTAGVIALLGDGTKSTGVNGQISAIYRF